MSCRNVFYMSVMFVIVPVWVGLLWTVFLRIEGRLNRLLHAWVFGFATMLAVAQLLLVPLVALQQTLTTAIMLWEIVMQMLSVVSFLVLLRRWLAGELFAPEKSAGLTQSVAAEGEECSGQRAGGLSGSRWTVIFGILAAALILLQAYIPARYEHSDDDDARFIAEEVSAVEHDTMYQDSPIHADYLYWNEGEVRKDLTSPWAMFVAMQAKLSGMAPAEISHAYLPFFLILICYALYLLIGKEMFHGDWEKAWLFLIVLSVIHLTGYTSTHTLASMLLLRIWQGKGCVRQFV